MPRLPDIRTESWLEDQQKRFQEATASTWDALEFQLGARQQEAQIPPDYDAVGGMDQWEETEKNLLADTYRAQQKAWEEQQRQEEEKRQQEIAAQAEQYRQQQQQAEAQAALAQQAQDSQQQQQESSMMDMIRGLGIPTPGDAFEGLQNFLAPRDPNSSTGVFDVSAPPQQQQASQSPTEAFNQFAGGMQTDAFGAPTPDPTQQQPDHTSSTGLLDRLGSAVRSIPGLIAETPDQALTAPANRYFSPTEKERETIGRGVEAATTFEPLERVSVPFTGREVEIPEAAQPYLGAAAGGLEALNAVTDYGRARVDPRTWTFAKDGIAREIFSPEETARWQYLFDPKDEQGFRRPGELSPEESAELARYDQRINDRYNEIKNDPDEITRLANSSPLYQAVSMASDIPLGIAAGGTASRAAATTARGLGAGARTARAAGYAADIAAQTAFDPSTPFIQPAADVALRVPGAAIRGARSLAGRAGEALIRSADEIPTGTERLGSGFQTAMDMEADPTFAGMRPRVIPTDVARQLDYFPLNVPTDPEVIKAVRRAGGTVDEHGVTINTIRNQGPEAAGGLATRGGTFHIAGPPGADNPMYAKSTSNATDVGGNQRIEGETTYRNPLWLDHAPGDGRGFDQAMQMLNVTSPATPESIASLERTVASIERRLAEPDRALYDQNHLRVQLDQRRRELEEARAGRGRPIRSTQISDEIREAQQAGPEASPERAQALKAVLNRYGGDPDLVDELLTIRGADASESAWAIRENIVTAHARKNRHDGVLALRQADVEDIDVTLPEIAQHPEVVAAQKAHDAARAQVQALDEEHEALKNSHMGEFARHAGEDETDYFTRIRRENNDQAFWDKKFKVGGYPDVMKVYERLSDAKYASEVAGTQLVDTQKAIARELFGTKEISELVDPRAGRNPTPGRVDPRVPELEQTIEALKGDEVRAWAAMRKALENNPGMLQAEMQGYADDIKRIQYEATDAVAELQELRQRGAEGPHRLAQLEAAFKEARSDATDLSEQVQYDADAWRAAHPGSTFNDAIKSPEIAPLHAKYMEAYRRSQAAEQAFKEGQAQGLGARPGYELRPDIPAPEGVRRSTIVENPARQALDTAQRELDAAKAHYESFRDIAPGESYNDWLARSMGPEGNAAEEAYRDAIIRHQAVQGDMEREPRWMTALGSGVSPRLRAPLFNAAQGGFFGAASENLEAQQEGREVDPATQLQRTLIGGGLGMLAGSRGARRLVGRTLQRLGSGVVPEGGATDPAPMIRLIRQMREAGASDDVIASAERDLAQKTDLTLDAIQQQTRGTADDVPPWEPTAAERAEVARQDAEIADRPAHGGYLPEDEVDVAEAGPSPTPYSGGIGRSSPGSTPYDRGLTADEARQLQIPGFEDVPEDVRPAGQNIRGYGNLPRPTRPPPGYLSREGEEFVRENIGPSDKLTRAQREQWAAELIDTDIERLRELQANPPDPVQAGIDQTALRMLTQDPVEYLVEAQRELQRLKEVVRRSDGPVPKDIAIEIATWQNEMALRATQAKMALGAASANVRASSKVLNAQKGAYEGAALVEEAQRADAVGKAAKAAAKTAQKIAKDAAGKVTDDDIKVLKEAADVMEVPGNKRAMARKPRTAAGEGGDGAGGTGRTRKPAAPKEPKEETLAERLGRLQLRMTRMEDTGAEVAERSALQSELDEVTRQIWERADEALGARLRTPNVEPTAAEAERLINEAVGRRFQRRVEGELRKSAPKTETPIQQAIKREIDRVTRSESWVQAAYDKQIRRRVDGELAREGRATVRAEVKDLAQAAQIWAKRIRQMPEQKEALGEEFNQILQRMRQHSDAGKRVADDLAERLDVNLQEDVYQRGFRESYQASRATEEASIQSVVDRIRDIQNNARGPEVHLRIAELYKELDEIGGAGIQKGSDLRRQANTRGILKSGLSMTDENYDAVVKLLEDVDPADPNSMKPIFALMRQPSWIDVVNEISYLNLLSRPTTFATNMSSTIGNGLLKLMIRNPAEFVGSMGQTRGQKAAFKGLKASAGEGYDLFKTTMRTGINPRRLERAVAKGEYQHVGREILPSMMEERGLWNLGVAKKAGGWMGEALHKMSTRPLEAMDAWMGHMAYTSAIYEKAQQHADKILREGGDELDDLGAVLQRRTKTPDREQLATYIINNIWDYPDIIETAGHIEDYTLFRTQNKDVLSGVMRQISKLKDIPPDATPGQKIGALLANFLLPFQNVPYNFTKQGLGNVAHGLVSPVTGPTALVKGAVGAATGDAAARTVAGERFARSAQGALLMGVPAMFAMSEKDSLTGIGPTDAGQRRIWLEDHKPNSYRLPYTDTWISYEGTPWAIPFSTVAGIKEAIEFGKPEEGESEGAMIARYLLGAGQGAVRGAASQSLVEPFMRNFEIFGPQASENNWAQFLAGAASRYSPHGLIAPVGSGMLGFLAGLADGVERDPGRARNYDDTLPVVRDVLQSQVPILRNRLPERRGAYGEVLEKPRLRGFLGYQGEASMPNDPITQELERGKVGIPTVPEEITIYGGKIPLTIKEQQRFQRLYGEQYRTTLEEMHAKNQIRTNEDLEIVRGWARKAAQDQILFEMGVPEQDKRWRRQAPVEVAP